MNRRAGKFGHDPSCHWKLPGLLNGLNKPLDDEAAVARSAHAREDRAFIDAVSEFVGE
ncbi:MAG: hypothetical protein L0271_20215 [Gemmatimonadetes bacterium]|nr:hypothetical protein [Gemmatimonadota bacterium]